MGRRFDKAAIVDVLNQALADGIVTDMLPPGPSRTGAAPERWQITIAGHPGPVEMNTSQAWAFGCGIEATKRALERPKLTLL